MTMIITTETEGTPDGATPTETTGTAATPAATDTAIAPAPAPGDEEPAAAASVAEPEAVAAAEPIVTPEPVDEAGAAADVADEAEETADAEPDATALAAAAEAKRAKKKARKAAEQEPGEEPMGGERIAKVLARAGLCSRREAEEWIAAGRVAIDGKVLTTPAVTVDAKSRISVDGRPIPIKERTRLWLFHKPRGLVTTTRDPEGRPTVFSVLPVDMPRVVTVGRLDINTEGLLLLTNDGGLARVLELPSIGWLRRYRVRAHGTVEQAALDDLKPGVSVDGVDYGSIEAEIDRVQGSNTWLVLGLREGKNREVKRVLGDLGLEVSRLIRISFGPFQLADLAEGEIREIRGRVLRDQLGRRLVAESGADFEAPILHHIPGDSEEEEAPKRRIRPIPGRSEERGGRHGEAEGGRGGKPIRRKMEYIGTGERGEEKRFRSEGFRGARPEGGAGGKPRSEGFRGRPDGDRPRAAGFRDRPDGDRPKTGGFRDRPEGDRPKTGGFRDRPEGDRPRTGGFRDRPEGDRPRTGGFRDRPEGDRPRTGGFRDRPEGDRPRTGGFRDRPEGDRPRTGFRDRPEGARGPRPEGVGEGRAPKRDFRSDGPRPDKPRSAGPRSEGFRGRPEGGPGRTGGFRDRPDEEKRPRSQGFRGRPSGEGGKVAGFRDRPERTEGGERAARPEPVRPDRTGFGPRGPRGMSPGGRSQPKGGRGDVDRGEAGDRRPPRDRAPGKGGPGGHAPKGGPKGPRGGKGPGPRGGGAR